MPLQLDPHTPALAHDLAPLPRTWTGVRRSTSGVLARLHKRWTSYGSIKFKHLKLRATSGFSFAWQQSEVPEPLAAAIPDLKKGIELLLVAPKNPLLTKTLIEFTLWAEENNWDYETLCKNSAF
jgi:hypothetical protein